MLAGVRIPTIGPALCLAFRSVGGAGAFLEDFEAESVTIRALEE